MTSHFMCVEIQYYVIHTIYRIIEYANKDLDKFRIRKLLRRMKKNVSR